MEIKKRNYLRRIRFFTLLFIIPLLGLVIGAGCGKKSQNTKNNEAVIPVKVMEITPDSIKEILSYTGSIEPWRVVKIVPDVGGKVAHIYVKIGDRVKAGEILAELDKETFQLRLKQAEAGVAVAKANFEDAEKNYKRAVDLKKNGSISEQQFEKIQLAYDAAKAQKEQAESALALAQWQLKVSVMRAPFDGVITGRWINEGEMINPQMPGAPGVVSLMDLSKVKIRVNASEQEVTKIRNGQKVYVYLDVYPGKTFVGKVFAVNQAANALTRTFEIQMVVPNQQGLLKAGMFARVDIVLQDKKEVIVIPIDALLGNEGNRYVYVVKKDTAVMRPVSLGIIQNDRVEILSGLAQGDELVVVGQQMLHQGAKVNLVGGE